MVSRRCPRFARTVISPTSVRSGCLRVHLDRPPVPRACGGSMVPEMATRGCRGETPSRDVGGPFAAGLPRAVEGDGGTARASVRPTCQTRVMDTSPSPRRWQDLSATQRRVVIVVGVITTIWQIAMLWDLRRRPAEQLHGSKRAWVLASFVRPFGQIAYYAWGRRR
ncbi:hypothetical protein FTX61_11910 [Nitriliruptoraceae bacterium ZYF776]|nr:hypothetical protein [Profundirhabdus halotolerans]